MPTRIGFAGQFGGPDADVVHSRFWGLKAAARELVVHRFPFPELHYILRVDGKFVQFKFSGLDNMKVGRHNSYISIDIGIQIGDRDRLVELFCSSILASVQSIEDKVRRKELTMDSDSLRETLSELVARYKAELSRQRDMLEESQQHWPISLKHRSR